MAEESKRSATPSTSNLAASGATDFMIECQDGEVLQVHGEEAHGILEECAYFHAAFASSGMKESTTRVLSKPNWTKATAENIVKLLASGSLSGLKARDLVHLAPALEELTLNVSSAGGLLDGMALADVQAYLSLLPWDDIPSDLNKETPAQWKALRFDMSGNRSLKLVKNKAWASLVNEGIVAVPTDDYHIRWVDKDRSKEPKTAYGGLMSRENEMWGIVSSPYNGVVRYNMRVLYQCNNVPVAKAIRKAASIIDERAYVEYEVSPSPIACALCLTQFVADKDMPEFIRRTGVEVDMDSPLDISGITSVSRLRSVLIAICELNKWGDGVPTLLKSLRRYVFGVRLTRPSNDVMKEFLALDGVANGRVVYEPNTDSFDFLVKFVPLASADVEAETSSGGMQYQLSSLSVVIQPGHMFRTAK